MAAPSTRNIVPLLPTTAAAQAAAFPAYLTIPRQRTKPRPLRRGHTFDPGWGTAYGPNPASVLVSVRARVKPGVLRRGHLTSDPPWVGAAVLTNGWLPGLAHPRRLVIPARVVRRSTFLTIPAVGPPTVVRARRVTSVKRPRAQAWQRPVAAAPDPAYPPQSLRSRVKVAALRRGRTFDMPYPAAAVVQPPPYPPQSLRSRVKPALLRRGRVWEPAWPQSVDEVVLPDPHGLQPRPSKRQVPSVGGIELVQVREPRKPDVASGPALTSWKGLRGTLEIGPAPVQTPLPDLPLAEWARVRADQARRAAHEPLVAVGRALGETHGLPAGAGVALMAGPSAPVWSMKGMPGELWLMPGPVADEEIPPQLLEWLFS